MNILQSVMNYVKDRVRDKDEEDNKAITKSAISTPSILIPTKKSMTFNVGEGLTKEQAIKAKEVVTAKPTITSKISGAPIKSVLKAELLPGAKENIISSAKADATRLKSIGELIPASNVTQWTGRGLMSAGLQLSGKNVYNPDPNSDFEKLVFGDSPIFNSKLTAQKTFGDKNIDVLNQGGLGTLALGLGINLLDASDLFTGGGKRTALNTISKLTKTEEIIPILRNVLGSEFDETLLKNAAKDLSSLGKYNEVRDYIKDLSGINKVLDAGRESKMIDNAFNYKSNITDNIVNNISSTGSTKKISDELNSIGILPESQKYWAEKLKNIKDPKEVYAILNNIDNEPVLGNKIGSINLEKLDLSPEAKVNFKQHLAEAKDDIEITRGKPVTMNEVLEASKESDVLRKVFTRADTLKLESSIQKAKNRISFLENALVETTNPNTRRAIIEESLDLTKAVDSAGTFTGRLLQSFKNVANSAEGTVINNILTRINKIGADRETVLKAAQDVNWNNADEVNTFYRQFVKPTFNEILAEYRYNNMLSSPRSHLRNLSTNLLQTVVTRPLTRAVEAGIDMVSSALSGKQREVYFKEVPEYYRTATKNIFNAFGDAFDAMKGKGMATQFMDVESKIPTGKLPKFMRIPTLALEAGDRFFTKLIYEGEKAALIKRGLSETKASKQASSAAKYSLFRQGLDTSNKTGQGELLTYIDKTTAVIDNLRKVPGGDWIVPFLRTPMNIAKQMIEYSPLGLFNLKGNTAKKEVLAKTFIGSAVSGWAAKEAYLGNTTWGVPKDTEEKELFYASGKKPYSVKIGGKWVPMIYFGPLAYALALPAAFKYQHEDSHTRFTDDEITKSIKSIAGMAEMWTQQTFLENIGNFMDMVGNQDGKSIGKNLAFTATQAIPLSGLMRYVSTIIDPIYRKANSMVETIEGSLPFLSKNLDAYRNPGLPGFSGEESRRESYNYIAPWDITSENDAYNTLLEQRKEKLDSNNFINQGDKKIKETAEKLLEDFMDDNVTDKRISEIEKELSSNEQLRNVFKGYVKKAGETESALINPIVTFKDPKYTAEIIYTRTQTSTSDEDWKNNVEDFIKMLEQNGLMTNDVKKELQKIVISNSENDKMEKIEEESKKNKQEEWELEVTN